MRPAPNTRSHDREGTPRVDLEAELFRTRDFLQPLNGLGTDGGILAGKITVGPYGCSVKGGNEGGRQSEQEEKKQQEGHDHNPEPVPA